MSNHSVLQNLISATGRLAALSLAAKEHLAMPDERTSKMLETQIARAEAALAPFGTETYDAACNVIALKANAMKGTRDV